MRRPPPRLTTDADAVPSVRPPQPSHSALLRDVRSPSRATPSPAASDAVLSHGAGLERARLAPRRRPPPPGRVGPAEPCGVETTPQTIAAPRVRARLAATAQSPIAPARVVDLGAPAADAMLRLCPRCRGGSDPTSHFCRFCGASLADAPSDLARPSRPAASAARGDGGRPQRGAHTGASRGSHAPVAGPRAARRWRWSRPSRVPAPRARLILIARDGGEVPGYPLGDASDIGRTEGNILLGDDCYVSPRHARIQARGGAYYLRDLGSTNGVYVRIPFAREGGAAGLGGAAHRRRRRRRGVEARRRGGQAPASKARGPGDPRAADRRSRLVPGRTTGAKV